MNVEVEEALAQRIAELWRLSREEHAVLGDRVKLLERAMMLAMQGRLDGDPMDWAVMVLDQQTSLDGSIDRNVRAAALMARR